MKICVSSKFFRLYKNNLHEVTTRCYIYHLPNMNQIRLAVLEIGDTQTGRPTDTHTACRQTYIQAYGIDNIHNSWHKVSLVICIQSHNFNLISWSFDKSSSSSSESSGKASVSSKYTSPFRIRRAYSIFSSVSFCFLLIKRPFLFLVPISITSYTLLNFALLLKMTNKY